MEIADRDILNVDLKIYALSLLRHAGAPLLPNDWRATVKEFSATLDRYAKAAGGIFDFAPLKSETAAFDGTLDRFYKTARGGNIPANEANGVIMRLERILVPLNYARLLRFSQDPALACPALPGLSSAMELEKSSGDVAHAVVTDLRRGANQYVAALREARTLVEGALA